MAIGDHLRVRRLGYWHHCIDLGDGTVVDYAPIGTGADRSVQIQRRPYQEFASKADEVEVIEYDPGESAPAATVAERALSMVGENEYSLLHRNCEHFCTWCKTGTAYSWQAFTAGLITGAGLALVSIAGTRRKGLPPIRTVRSQAKR